MPRLRGTRTCKLCGHTHLHLGRFSQIQIDFSRIDRWGMGLRAVKAKRDLHANARFCRDFVCSTPYCVAKLDFWDLSKKFSPIDGCYEIRAGRTAKNHNFCCMTL